MSDEELRKNFLKTIGELRERFPPTPVEWIVVSGAHQAPTPRSEPSWFTLSDGGFEVLRSTPEPGKYVTSRLDDELFANDLMNFIQTPDDHVEPLSDLFVKSLNLEARAERPEIILRRCVYCGCHTDRLETEWDHGRVKSTTPVCPRSNCRRDYEESKK